MSRLGVLLECPTNRNRNSNANAKSTSDQLSVLGASELQYSNATFDYYPESYTDFHSYFHANDSATYSDTLYNTCTFKQKSDRDSNLEPVCKIRKEEDGSDGDHSGEIRSSF